MRANAGLFGIFVVSMAVFVALFMGLVSAFVPWWLALMLFTPPVLIWAGAKWPLVAMFVALLTAYGFLPIGIVMTDAVVLGFVLFVAVIRYAYVPSTIVRLKTIWTSLFAFQAWAFVSMVYGLFYMRNNLQYTYEESVTVAYWLLIIPIALMGIDKKRANYTMYILITMSVFLSILAILQSVFAMRLSFSGLAGAAELTSEEGGIAGLARSMMPGVLMVIFTFVLSTIKLTTGARHRGFWWALLILNSMAIFVTFGRAVWAMTALNTVIAAALTGRKAFVRLLVFGGGLFMFLIVALLVFKPEFVLGALNRLLSLRDEFSGKGTSLQWRLLENHFAYITMANHPVLGIGLGGEYKPRLIDMRSFSAQTHYIHNGYFFVIMKMGFIGLMFYMAHYLNILRYCWESQKFASVDRAPQLALIAVFLGTLILNITQPEFMQGPSIASLATIAAVVISVGYWQRQPEPQPVAAAGRVV